MLDEIELTHSDYGQPKDPDARTHADDQIKVAYWALGDHDFSDHETTISNSVGPTQQADPSKPSRLEKFKFPLRVSQSTDYFLDFSDYFTQIAPGVSEKSMVDAQRICQNTTLTSYDNKTEKPRTLLEAFNHIAEQALEHNPETLQDLITIVTNADTHQRITILEAFSRGLVLGSKVMGQFSCPVQQAVEEITVVDAKPDQPCPVSSDFISLSDEFGMHLEESFAGGIYLKGLSTLAGILENPHSTLSSVIFEGSDSERTLGYSKNNAKANYEDAMYALQIANYSLLQMTLARNVLTVEEVNKFGSGSRDVIYENPQHPGDVEASTVTMHIRSETEYNKGPSEYGRGKEAEASVSKNVDASSIDRRGILRSKPTYDRTKSFRKNAKDYLNHLNEQIVSLRIDYEGDANEGRRGISLDFGAVLGNKTGLSFVVGNFFAIGDIRMAEREGRDTTLNHSPLMRKKFGRPDVFKFIANSILYKNRPAAVSNEQRLFLQGQRSVA